jgi:hypothetical protein
MPELSSLSFKERTALVDLVNGKQIDHVQLLALERRGLVQMIPALTSAGTELAEEAGWKRPPWED